MIRVNSGDFSKRWWRTMFTAPLQ